MRFEEQMHWSEGLFLQPHHLQLLQMNQENLSRKQRELVLPFAYGFCDLELDLEALKARRISIKRFSAVMPDGQELSMPGNCNIGPLTLDLDTKAESSIMIYLVLPLWSNQEKNLSENAGLAGRFTLKEISVVDENTSDNEIPVMVRRFNASLTSDLNSARNCTVLPLCRVNWVVINASMPSLAIEETYIPPFIKLTKDCALHSRVNELLFQMRSAHSAMLSGFENQGFDSETLNGQDLLNIIKLKTLSRYIQRLDTLIVPGRITPFMLYEELVTFLAELESLDPLLRSKPYPVYDHDNLRPVIIGLIDRIAAIILKGGLSSALSFQFTDNGQYLELSISDERVFEAQNIFLALEFNGSLSDRVPNVENGDNFRLIDKSSFTDRIRGVKLSELRLLPHYLPNLPNTIWFKVQREQSERVWKFIAEDRMMIIDSAKDLFPQLKATLYVNVEENRDV